MRVTDAELLARAADAMRRAWAPYSGFSVGAAILAGDGRVFDGCNVENASYGLTVCAERVAVFKAVSEGARAFERLALVCDGPRPVTPCGACLQVLREFGPDLPVVYAVAGGRPRRTSLKKLLPSPFRAADLGPGSGSRGSRSGT
ncbi:MAG: cytidine deaminase [Planctomycetes bacterium]|jgi:cytidine deaminase|nr:cytidine deaminase [Planctomycetota bacterium]